MKISELTSLLAVSRDVKIPVAVAGQTMSITLGQLMDSLHSTIVPFSKVTSQLILLASGETTHSGFVEYSTASDGFFYKVITINADAPNTFAHYTQWPTRDLFYDGDDVRQDCLFVDAEGGLWKHNGTTLIRVGLNQNDRDQLILNTPIRVESEEEMERMIEDGEVVEGQLYYVPEE